MSRPRQPFGARLPGRLPATMIKVLAAELSDSGRLARGKRYWSDDAVTDIVIEPGSVTGVVQGSRRTPYTATIDVSPGDGVPGRRDVRVRCTCPDDAGNGMQACKHAIAVMFTLSDEVAIEPEIIVRWRSGDADGFDTDDPADERDVPDNVIAFPGTHRPDRAEHAVGGGEHAVGGGEHENGEELDEMARLLSAPTGRGVEPLPTPMPWSRPDVRDPLIEPLLDDVLDHLEIHWE